MIAMETGLVSIAGSEVFVAERLFVAPETAAIFVRSFCAASAPEPSTIPGSDLPSDFRNFPRVTDMVACTRAAAHGSSRWTIWLSVLPSAWPAALTCAAFITEPICALLVAPTSAMASLTSCSIFSGRHLRGQERLEEIELLFFLVGEIGTARLRIAGDGILALFGLLADDGDDFEVGGDGNGAALFNGGILHRRLEHPEHG